MADYTVDISAMRTRVTFQEPTIVMDAGGAQTTTWANVATTPTVWSKWVYDHGQELVQAGAATSVLRATVTVRYRSDILSTWRILKGGVAWQIISPPENVQDENRWTVFRVEQVKGTV